jgi:hypothetical protein
MPGGERSMNPQVIQSIATTEAEAFLRCARSGLAKGLRKITHCLNQLDDQQLWDRPRPEMNSIANILIHLCGNLRQWIISGVGGSPDVRNRPAEFADRSMKPKAQLVTELENVIAQCDEVFAHADPKSLLKTRRIQGFDVQLMAAIFDTVSHLQGHVQEIIHMTRALKGPAYRFDFVPKGKEQGGTE